jgi:hypothetical protein
MPYILEKKVFCTLAVMKVRELVAVKVKVMNCLIQTILFGHAPHKIVCIVLVIIRNPQLIVTLMG